MKPLHPLLIDGVWTSPEESTDSFSAADPSTGEDLTAYFPLSGQATIDRLLNAAGLASRTLANTAPTALASFLDNYATAIDEHAEELATLAHRETGLPRRPRLLEVEIPRTIKQLRDAAQSARSEDWTMPTIDTAHDIRSRLESLAKPVLVMGPNNFPFAYNGICGGDFAAAVATGHAVIAKSHPAHPGTTQRLAELALVAATAAHLPPATVQLFYHCSPEVGLSLAGDSRLGAIGFTGSETAGRKIKAAADAVGTPGYFEMSGVNPVTILPGALVERPEEIAHEFCDSCHQGTGQFCTSPGLVLTVEGLGFDRFLAAAAKRFDGATLGPMLSRALPSHLKASVKALLHAGALMVARGTTPAETGFTVAPVLLRVSGRTFLNDPAVFQNEMFGPAALVVVAANSTELVQIAQRLNASLTGSIYSVTDQTDDLLYERISSILAPRIGRLLNDKMPTGVAVSPAMMHGGPFPAGGHPGFTAVGMPASLRRFGALRCYDHVRPHRLPASLRNENPTGKLWRSIDGVWTQSDASASG
ncbi:aldehyde dehydrogenase family protein [Synoicihabitans lomoniglobus]|uniref:Aldehyde dehydrogenase family protein n=1 Tax=Synoicihabitans lomoniglobus TaxID=2909285 RepID=A0AAF0CRF0_9BACT|nr:aldehyde dehydrogenase family protein [Opitutaceae bacterium LMO-M01]WED66698.1 aldehyde dehydrogenase family protein [Opitutaceae bacterium LMO-M01]